MIFLLQTSTTEAFTRVQQTIGLISVNVGVAIAAFLLVLKTYNDIKSQLKQTKQAAQEIIQSKEEIVEASQKNYRAIQENTAITEKQAINIQRHILERVSQQFNILSHRIGHIEAKLSTDEDGTAPTTAWEKDDKSSGT